MENLTQYRIDKMNAQLPDGIYIRRGTEKKAAMFAAFRGDEQLTPWASLKQTFIKIRATIPYLVAKAQYDAARSGS